MNTIKGFTTKGKTATQVLDELGKAGCTYKLPFSASVELNVKNNPFTGSKIVVDDCNGKQQKIEKKDFTSKLAEAILIEKSLTEKTIK